MYVTYFATCTENCSGLPREKNLWIFQSWACIAKICSAVILWYSLQMRDEVKMIWTPSSHRLGFLCLFSSFKCSVMHHPLAPLYYVKNSSEVT